MRLPTLFVAVVLFTCAPLLKHSATAAAVELTAEAITADAALQTKVSFEAKAQPFSEFLRDLSRQSPVNFTVAPELEIAKRLLTARVHDLPLAQVMTSLSQLYNLSWMEDEGAFRAVVGNRNSVEQRVGQIGRWYRHWKPIRKYFPVYLTRRGLADRYETRRDEAQIMDELWFLMRDAKVKNGVPLTALPGDLQERLRFYVENSAGDSLLTTLRAARMENLLAGTLVVKSPFDTHNAEGKVIPNLQGGLLVARIQSPGEQHLQWQLLTPHDRPADVPVRADDAR